MRALACHGAFLILTSKPVTLGRSSNSSVFLSSLTLEVSIRFAKCLSENAVTIMYGCGAVDTLRILYGVSRVETVPVI